MFPRSFDISISFSLLCQFWSVFVRQKGHRERQGKRLRGDQSFIEGIMLHYPFLNTPQKDTCFALVRHWGWGLHCLQPTPFSPDTERYLEEKQQLMFLCKVAELEETTSIFKLLPSKTSQSSKISYCLFIQQSFFGSHKLIICKTRILLIIFLVLYNFHNIVCFTFLSNNPFGFP